MFTIHKGAGLFAAVALLVILVGCSKKAPDSAVPPANPANPKDVYNNRLNDKNVSPQDAEQIRRHMGEGKGGAAATGSAAPGGFAPAPGSGQ